MEQDTKRIKIKIKTNFSGSDFEVEVPAHYNVRQILISTMPQYINESIIDKEISEEWEILINEKEIWFYKDKFETRLKEGDLLEVYLTPLGGG
ncbi:MAG TPA: hypothetical protein PK800_02460 [Syntrophorhabdaceae bacterium]|nr:hypothetical protein [Syntrophorhabdaceae bacterium]